MDEMFGEEETMSDESLLATLRAAAAREPVPPAVLAAARDAFAWRLLDAELAELIADSALEPVLAGTRGAGEPRLVTFEVPGGTALELEASPSGAGLRLVGQVVPGRAGTAVVQHPGGTVDCDVDEVGRFAAHGIQRGPMRVRLRLQGAGPAGQPALEIVTASLTL